MPDDKLILMSPVNEEFQMSNEESNAQRFLNAFAAIEEILSRQQGRRADHDDWAKFYELVADSSTLLQRQKEKLRHYARLRNAISHTPYFKSKPIADPRIDTVEEIIKIQHDLEKPPLLVDALEDTGAPRIFNPNDNIDEFLELVKAYDFSQAPVKTESGFALITTNAIARWFAHSLSEHGGVIESTPIHEVLKFAESGDQLKTVNPSITTVEAINYFSGLADTNTEPPAALLVLGKMGQVPQRLAVRADLSLLYTQLES